jgi:hypothetical protein
LTARAEAAVVKADPDAAIASGPFPLLIDEMAGSRE